MAFIPARCTQCGANIEVDDTKDAGICKHCSTAFVTKKAINNYNTYVTNDFTGANVNVVGGDVNNYIIIGQHFTTFRRQTIAL
jgi:DNA-directed RNA polymerase subunit RPC12/RpoP